MHPYHIPMCWLQKSVSLVVEEARQVEECLLECLGCNRSTLLNVYRKDDEGRF